MFTSIAFLDLLSSIYLGHAVGRQAMLTCNVIPRLAELFDDKEASVRRNAHKAVSMYSEASIGKTKIVGEISNVFFSLFRSTEFDWTSSGWDIAEETSDWTGRNQSLLNHYRIWVHRRSLLDTDFEYHSFLSYCRCWTSLGCRCHVDIDFVAWPSIREDQNPCSIDHLSFEVSKLLSAPLGHLFFRLAFRWKAKNVP